MKRIETVMKTGLLGMTGLMMLGLGACSTTSGVGAAAPITYKIDQGHVGMASTGQTGPNISVQNPVSRPSPAPHVTGMPGPHFDQSKVDKNLYAHQKVGRPYKVFGKTYTPRHQPDYDKTGMASWYGPNFNGKLTANGEVFDMNAMTAAHKTLPLNSMVHVTNLATGQSVELRINDRGPFVDGRIIDLSRAAALRLGLFNAGTGEVRVQYAGPADPNTLPRKAARPQTAPVPAPQAQPQPKPKEAPIPYIAPEENSDLVAEAPKYKPLRDLGTPPQAQSQAPQKPHGFELPGEPRYQIEQPATPAPQANEQQAEQMPAPEDSNEPVTLTIKGPIHMATSRSDVDQNDRPKFIPAVRIEKIPAGVRK